MKKRIDEKAKTRKQLQNIGEKIKGVLRKTIKQISENLNIMNHEKAQMLKEIIENIVNHYQDDHSQVFAKGKIIQDSRF